MELDELYRTYSRKVYCYLLSLSGDPDLSEDLMQETFLKAAASIQSFRHESSLSTWLCAIAKRLYLDACRRRRPQADLENLLLQSCSSPRDLRLFSFLHRLKEPFREIVFLRTFCLLSYKEIGEVLGKSDSWVRVMFYRGKKMMQDMIQKEETSDD